MLFHEFRAKLNESKSEIKKVGNRWVVRIDGERLDVYDSESDAKKAAEEFIRLSK